MQVDCTLDSDPAPAPFLGVSPPVRSGACNPLAVDSQWKQKAQQASRTSLEALQSQLDRTAARPRCPTAQCRGDYRLLLSPPEYGGGLLGAALSRDAAACDPQQGMPHRNRHLVPASNAISWRASSRSPDARIFG